MNQLSSCLRSAQDKLWAISKHIIDDEKNMVVLPWIWPGQILVLGPTKTLRPAPDQPTLMHLASECFAPYLDFTDYKSVKLLIVLQYF